MEINKKICYDCNEEKIISNFYKNKAYKDGYLNQCKTCRKNYYNREDIKIRTKTYNAKNKKKKAIYMKEYRKIYLLENKDKIQEYQKKFYLDNKEKIYDYQFKTKDRIKTNQKKRNRERYKEDGLYKLKISISNGTNKIITSKVKSGKYIGILGCNSKEFINHIEKQFVNGMTWSNYGYGNDKWNIDHKICLMSAKTKEEMLNLAHYNNIQPLWQKENFRKKPNNMHEIY